MSLSRRVLTVPRRKALSRSEQTWRKPRTCGSSRLAEKSPPRGTTSGSMEPGNLHQRIGADMASASIKDVAAAAGVSVGTVSNVLNRPAAVRPTTRAKVEAAITRLGFVPNASARQLAAGRSRTLAYLVLDAS